MSRDSREILSLVALSVDFSQVEWQKIERWRQNQRLIRFLFPLGFLLVATETGPRGDSSPENELGASETVGIA